MLGDRNQAEIRPFKGREVTLLEPGGMDIVLLNVPQTEDVNIYVCPLNWATMISLLHVL